MGDERHQVVCYTAEGEEVRLSAKRDCAMSVSCFMLSLKLWAVTRNHDRMSVSLS